MKRARFLQLLAAPLLAACVKFPKHHGGALPADSTGSKYDMLGLREDLHDMIYRISPEDTPFMSSVKGSTWAEHQTDELF